MGPQSVLRLAPKPGNPRNSEGDFIRLKNGTIRFIYTHFDGPEGRDDSPAHLAARNSTDGGGTWSSEDEMVIPSPGGVNVMSVSLLRLRSGRIAMLYLHKLSARACVPYLTFSSDETVSWTPSKCIVKELDNYHVVNNDRMIQLRNGRLVVPVAIRRFLNGVFSACEARCLLSDDEGQTWRWSQSTLPSPAKSSSGLQEPGVIELKDGGLMMLSRTDLGCQYRSWSTDAGETWLPPEPTAITSPLSPASLARIPSTGDLLMVWNDHRKIDESLKNKRTPLRAAISTNEGRTWTSGKTLFDDPKGWYCYTAIEFIDNKILLAHCAGTRTEVRFSGLDTTQITMLDVAWLYE